MLQNVQIYKQAIYFCIIEAATFLRDHMTISEAVSLHIHVYDGKKNQRKVND